MTESEINGLEHSEISLSTATFAIVLTQLVISTIILYTETPYTLINENKQLFQMIWVTSASVVGFNLSAMILFLYAKINFLETPNFSRWVQKIGLISLIMGLMAFILSILGLVWGYVDTDELLGFSNTLEKIITFIILTTIITFGFLFVGIHMLYKCCFKKTKKRTFEYDDVDG